MLGQHMIDSKAIHFVGFRDDRYWNAVKIFGQPDFIHRVWDTRGQQEVAEGDVIVFAKGEHTQPTRRSFNDSAVIYGTKDYD